MGLAGWVLTQTTGVGLVQDALYYDKMGQLIARDWLEGRSSEWLSWAIANGRARWLMPAMLAGFYWLTGGVQIMPLLLAACGLITAWTPVVVYRIARHLGVSGFGAQYAGLPRRLLPGVRIL